MQGIEPANPWLLNRYTHPSVNDKKTGKTQLGDRLMMAVGISTW